eukprot:TRINITY_DN1228_c0_g1_i12.p1 TRINITY_DN1228_c0_g1~~TRINITY_DN1228_c0_g1_i12.p1  ORF type:complete len:161 (-),score=44.25 TRINITY_DN1228_c0_g1_i12:132-590(-)
MDLEKKYYKKQYKKGVQHYKKQYKKTTKHYKKQYKKATQHYKKAMKKAWYLQEEQEEGVENTHADARSLLNSRTEEESDDVDPWKKANKQYKKSVKKYDKNMKKAYKKGWYLQEELMRRALMTWISRRSITRNNTRRACNTTRNSTKRRPRR